MLFPRSKSGAGPEEEKTEVNVAQERNGEEETGEQEEARSRLSRRRTNRRPGLFKNFFSSRDMGVDLGTTSTLVFVRNWGVLFREPSVVAFRQDSNEVLAVGTEAQRMLGRTPGNVTAVRPMKEGVIADFNSTEKMLGNFITKARRQGGLMRPRIVISVPSGVTEVEKRAVVDVAYQARAREAYLIEEPMAAAFGAGLPVENPVGNMIVDIGGGTTEVAVISLGAIVTCNSIRTAGDAMNDAIVRYVKEEHKLMIGERTAEKIKMAIGSAISEEKNNPGEDGAEGDEGENGSGYEVRGRDLISGLPKTLIIRREEIREVLEPPIENIIHAVNLTLERTPPELSSDIMERGIVMSGGGALLSGLDKMLTEKTGVPVFLAEHPLECVARGTGRVLEGLDEYSDLLIQPSRLPGKK